MISNTSVEETLKKVFKMNLELKQKPVVNPLIVLREDFDDWCLLFDPDSGEVFGLNPVSVFIWKHLDGNHSPQGIVDKLAGECNNMPDDALDYVVKFIDRLLEKGLAAYPAANEQ